MDNSDRDIRQAFHKSMLKNEHASYDSIIIDELGLFHGRKRIDIAVINGTIHGYEIKSDKDKLTRLPDQIKEFSKCLEKLTIITAQRHYNKVIDIVPDWCGIVVAEGYEGGISFEIARAAKSNENIDLVALSHLLWRKEAIELLKKIGVDETKIRGNRGDLYNEIAEASSFQELIDWIKYKFMLRENWRAAGQYL